MRLPVKLFPAGSAQQGDGEGVPAALGIASGCQLALVRKGDRSTFQAQVRQANCIQLGKPI